MKQGGVGVLLFGQEGAHWTGSMMPDHLARELLTFQDGCDKFQRNTHVGHLAITK